MDVRDVKTLSFDRQDETVPSPRCDRKTVFEESEAIFDCTGGDNIAENFLRSLFCVEIYQI